MKTIKNYALLFLFILSSFSVFAHFGSKGPYGGTVTCSIVNDTTVYLGTKEGGVFESTNTKLVAWRARPVGLKSGKITALANSGKYLFAATADSGVYIFNGYVGSDRYWQKINNGLGNLKITALVALDSITILAGTDGSGVYKSVNKGASWTLISSTPINGTTVTGFAKAGNHLFLTSANTGVFISSDNGATWADFNDTNTLNIAGTTSISFNATTNQLIISNKNGLYSTLLTTPPPVAAYTAVSTGLPANTTIRSVSNNGSVWLLATDAGVYISQASPINWTASNAGLTTMNVNTVVAFQSSLVAGTTGEGIFKASIASPTWAANNFGFNNLATYSMACSGEAVVVAATEKGVFVSKDLANSYKRANKGLSDSLNVKDLVFWGTKLLAATENAGVFISEDTGSTWMAFNNGLTTHPVQKIVTAPGYAYLYNDSGEIFLTTGTSWIRTEGGLPSNIKPTAFVFYKNVIALATHGNGVYISVLGDMLWTGSNTGLSNLNVTSLAAQGNTIFAGTDGDGVFVSDSTYNWKKTALTSISHTTLIGLNGNRIQAMATYKGYVFASYKGGLLATSDYGATWIAGGNQFNLPSYTNVNKIDFVTTRVFVTTENNSLYSNALSELPPVGIEEIKSNIGYFTIYPNPSNGVIHLDFTNIQGSAKQIIVYDVLGKKMHQMATSGQLNETVELQLATGVYFIQVITNNGSTTQKISME